MNAKPTYEELCKKISDLEAKTETYLSIVDRSQDLFYRTDLEGRISFVSPSVFRLSGYTVEESIGMQMAEKVYLVPKERNTFLIALKENGKISNFQARLKRKDGSVWWASTSAHFFKDPDGNIAGVEGVTRDISELKATEIELRAAEEKFRLAFHTSPDSINLNKISDGQYIEINQGFTDLTGYTREDVIGKSSLEINIWKHTEDRDRLVKGLMESGLVKNLEAQFLRKNGETGVGLMSASILRINNEDIILSITRDITKQIKVENQLRQSQKMEAIGTFAGGIAHDFNNILSGIFGYADLANRNLSNPDKAKKHIAQIKVGARRAADLVQQILTFSRRTEHKKSPIKLYLIVKEVIKFLHSSIPSNITIKEKILTHSMTMADPTQIHQILMNLSTNASQAMKQSGGILSISLKDIKISESKSTIDSDIETGNYIQLEIKDTGKGMEPELLTRIFEPYFTTKNKEDGTGLGLPVVLGIIKQYNGYVKAYSELGKGSTFHVYFPILKNNIEINQSETAKKVIKNGSENIMLVDDDNSILASTKEIIEGYGYKVSAFVDGEQAFKEFKNKPDLFDLIITDRTMPKMVGEELSKEILNIRNDIPIILCSGYQSEPSKEQSSTVGIKKYLQKPVASTDLLFWIQKLLYKNKKT
jgi:PAS domain S-box-containing protein